MLRVSRYWENEHVAELEKKVALPAAGELAHSAAVDTLPADPANALIEIHVGATAAAAGKSVKATVEHSADGVNFVACGGLAGLLLVGDGETGGTREAVSLQDCPVGMGRYIRLVVEVEADAGDLTAAFAYVAAVPQPSAVGHVG